jgi:hypothetical protein
LLLAEAALDLALVPVELGEEPQDQLVAELCERRARPLSLV